MAHHQPDADRFADAYGWRCPICNSIEYRRSKVSTRAGTPYRPDIYECTGCTLMFRHPPKFSRLGINPRGFAGDKDSRNLRSVHGFVLVPGHTEPVTNSRNPGGEIDSCQVA